MNSAAGVPSDVHAWKEISDCRICRSKRLVDILDLGRQALTGVFPYPGEQVLTTPLVVCKCDHCHLVQLRHTVHLPLMYGDSYGYRSSLNGSMVRHLQSIARRGRALANLRDGDVILDIGSNDATYLKCFDSSRYTLIGVDPTAAKFIAEYGQQPSGGEIKAVADFFSRRAFESVAGDRKVRLVTSIACFYDLENPIEFAAETAQILEDDGIWIMEMAYLPSIIRHLCFDGYVQEHLEYYSLRDIKYIMDQVGLKIVDVELTPTNGGSFLVTVTHEANRRLDEYWRLNSLLLEESHLARWDTHLAFAQDVSIFKAKLVELLVRLKDSGKRVMGLGASTKFNVVLQYCGIGPELISCIGEVNEWKLGRVTPGTGIPIVAEAEVIAAKPDYIVVGPYHFRDSFVESLSPIVEGGCGIIFPLPNLEVYRGSRGSGFSEVANLDQQLAAAAG